MADQESQVAIKYYTCYLTSETFISLTFFFCCLFYNVTLLEIQSNSTIFGQKIQYKDQNVF